MKQNRTKQNEIYVTVLSILERYAAEGHDAANLSSPVARAAIADEVARELAARYNSQTL